MALIQGKEEEKQEIDGPKPLTRGLFNVCSAVNWQSLVNGYHVRK